MKNHKQMLADFYLELLAIPATDIFRITHQSLYAQVRQAIAIELQSDNEIIQNIFERMASEDKSYTKCLNCGEMVANRATHSCSYSMRNVK